MKMLTEKHADAQPWEPGYWITCGGVAMDPTDLRFGADPEDNDPRRKIVATINTNLIIRRMMES